MNRHYDVIVIGSGNAGLAAASRASEAGLSVAVIESRDVGGTCPIRGCVPKKVLVAAAQVLDQIQRAPEHHITVDNARLDWQQLIAREQDFVTGVAKDFEASLASRGIDVIKGVARFASANSVTVGTQELSASKFVIASGSMPRPLDIEGSEHLITSDEVLTMSEQPRKVVFIGGGVIALEFAHVLIRAGVEVLILELAPRLLSRMDGDAVAVLRKETERLGIEVRTGVGVERITRSNGQLSVAYTQAGTSHLAAADQVVNGTGRVANIADLDLGVAGVETTLGRIAVDPCLRSTSNPDVYVAGDALWASPQLSPVASYEGRIVGDNLVEDATHRPDYSAIPANVYTVPALASVGLTAEDARAQGFDVEIRENDMRGWRSSRTYAETASYAKVLLDRSNGSILGAHLVGHGAEETIHLFALAIRNQLKADALRELVYGYPTFSSDIRYLL